MTAVFIGPLATIAMEQMWSEMLNDNWIKKLWFMYSMEYYSAI